MVVLQMIIFENYQNSSLYAERKSQDVQYLKLKCCTTSSETSKVLANKLG